MTGQLSYAQIQQRRDAARSRWEHVGAAVGVGALAALGSHTASRIIRRKMANTLAARIASKMEAVKIRTNAGIETRKINRLKTIDILDDRQKKASKAKPQTIIAARLKQLDILKDRLMTHIDLAPESKASDHRVPNVKERTFFRHPTSGYPWQINVPDAVYHYKTADTESKTLANLKLPYKTYRSASVHRPKNQPEAPKLNPHMGGKVKVTRGKATPKEIADLRNLLYAGPSIKAVRLRQQVLRAAMHGKAKNAEQMENIHAKLRAKLSPRFTRNRHALVTVGAGALGAGAGYSAANLHKSDDTFANKVQKAFESLKEQTHDMIYNVANGVAPFDIDAFRAKLHVALEPLTDYFLKGMAQGVKADRPKTIDARFDLLQPAIFGHLDGSRTQLIVNLTEEQRNNITKLVTEGLAAGHAPARIARNLRPSIGLTDKQIQFVQNYKNDLALNSSKALARELRDKRYDKTVAKAVKSGVPLKNDQINRMVDAYGRKFLAFRSNTIARDQSLAAVNLGHVSTIKELASKHGLMVEKTWKATKDNRTREAHRDLDGHVVTGVDTPFNSELGPIRYPYDPDATAANTIQCRCHLGFRLMPMNQITDISP